MLKEKLGFIYHPVLHRIRKLTLFIKPKPHFYLTDEIRRNRIYVDVSWLHADDQKTGIHRVTKEIVSRITKYNQGFDVVCVYSTDTVYGYFECEGNKPVSFKSGDIFFVLNLYFKYVRLYDSLFKNLIRSDIPVFFYLHDLIPVRYPETLEKQTLRYFTSHLKRIINYTGIICNSKSTRDDLENWLRENPGVKRNEKLFTGYSLPGCSFHKSIHVNSVSAQKSDSVSFLIVSTVEPRKKYDQVIKAFNLLWEKGLDVTLTIVGKKGWKVCETVKLIENNCQYGKKLFWYNTGISDRELIEKYENSDCVIFASMAEGFGLAVAEAAYFKKPLILRDLPVFRETAGENERTSLP